jgi:hypothetical protein
MTEIVATASIRHQAHEKFVDQLRVGAQCVVVTEELSPRVAETLSNRVPKSTDSGIPEGLDGVDFETVQSPRWASEPI